MPSALQSTPGILSRLTNVLGGKLGSKDNAQNAMERIRRLGLSPRQQELNRLWAVYRCTQYAHRKLDWSGRENVDELSSEVISSQGYIPPGFVDMSRQSSSTFPLKFRRPTAPYALVKVVVDRFTGLLFSEQQHPEIKVDGDPQTEDWLRTVVEAARLWPALIQARAFGGAMGTACLGFQFINGKPTIEVHDPRWVFPEFSEHGSTILTSIEKRYTYKKEVRDQATGRWEEKDFWYRRIIDEQSDVLYQPVEVSGEEPAWQEARRVDHGFGFCPVVWVQNLPVQDSEDGDPDCPAPVYEMEATIDALVAQANRAIIANCFGRETKFVTHEGVRSFADFEDGQSTRVLTHAGNWKPAIVKSFGEQSLFRMTICRGASGRPISIRATRDHRWLLADGSETTHLQVGDRLLSAPPEFSKFEYSKALEDEKKWWCAGFIWGDGSTVSSGGKTYGSAARLCGKKAAWLGRFLENDFSVTYPPSAGGEPVVRTKENYKALPPSDSETRLLRAFVRGFIDADGTVSKKASSRWKRIQVTGEASIAFVRRVFPQVGLYITCEAALLEPTNFGNRSAPTVRFELNENRSQAYQSTWRVISIEEDAIEKVWCLHTEDDRSLVLPCGIATGQCDPQLVITTKAEMSEVKLAQDQALRIPDGSATFLEVQATGPKAALELAENLRKRALEVAQCVLEHPDVAGKTATEVERMYQSMIQKADVMREQYGQRGILPLLEMIYRAAIQLEKPRIAQVAAPGVTPAGAPEQEGQQALPAEALDGIVSQRPAVVRGKVVLPPRYQVSPEGALQEFERLPGLGGTFTLRWPGYFPPSLDDVTKATTAAVSAMTGGIIDDETAVGFVAPYFKVEDKGDLLEKIRSGAAQQQVDLMAMMASAARPQEPEVQSAAQPGATEE